MTKEKSVFSTATKLVLSVFFVVCVLLPLLAMLGNLKGADLPSLLTDGRLHTAALNSVAVSLTATLIAVLLASLAAWCVQRTKAALRPLFHLLLLLPMLVPSISHGMGLMILLGNNGSLSKLLGLTQGVYGFWGIVLGSVMYAFPVAYLMISDILKYEDSTPYEAARVLGLPRHRRLSAITLPYLKKPFISVLFATFTLIVTDYGVPLMIGGMYKTLPVLMYEEVIGSQDFTKGSLFGVILLLPAVAAFLIDLLSGKDKQNGTVKKPFSIEKRPLRDGIATGCLTLLSSFTVIPLVSFLRIAFAERYPTDLSFSLDSVESTLRKGGQEFLLHSLLIALFVAVIGCLAAFLCAYVTARLPGRGSGFLHLMSLLSLAVPGMVLGLSYAVFFSGSFLYGTMAILILVNIIHFFSSPYLMIYNSLGKLNPHLEAVGSTLGIGRVRLLLHVILPQTALTIAEMFSYFFVNSMMTISAVTFLYSLDTKPLSLLIPQFKDQIFFEGAAFVSLMILAANLVMKGIIWLLRTLISHRKKALYAHQKAV